MPGVSIQGSLDSGHGCFPPRPSTEGSSDVFVNGSPAHREGDSWAIHNCGDSFHDGSLASGSSTVFVNGKALGRIGDDVDCGSVVAQGSPNVNAGG